MNMMKYNKTTDHSFRFATIIFSARDLSRWYIHDRKRQIPAPWLISLLCHTLNDTKKTISF